MRLNEPLLGAEAIEDLSPEQISVHIQLAKQGDDESAEILIRVLEPCVSKILNSRLRFSQDRDDVAQEIYARIFKKLDQYSGTVPLQHWVSRIAANACCTHYRKAQSNKELRLGDLTEEEESYIEAVSMRTPSEDPMAGFAHSDFIQKLLETLRPEDQQVIRLVYLQGLSHKEVANITGWSTSLSKVRAHRAMNRIKKSLQNLLDRKPLEFSPQPVATPSLGRLRNAA
jgi:RNA polymerase sigma factor (sigma-70 family)